VRSSGTFKFKWVSALALTPLFFSAATPHSVAAQAHGAGAGIAGDRAADNGFMKAVSTEVRRVIAQSGRHHLVDFSGVDADAVRDHSLRTCNGCDAGIASALGAEQSLTGVVRRISRTEYVVGFQLRDAKSGTLIAAQDTGLRMGANYSWSRGASRLIEDRLLTGRVKLPNPSN
jgi:Protein of unknown function (DUF2380)